MVEMSVERRQLSVSSFAMMIMLLLCDFDCAHGNWYHHPRLDNEQKINSFSGGDAEGSNIILMNHLNKQSRFGVNNISPDDIRCYCNLPVCVTNGYMCRTRINGGCFSEKRNIGKNLKIPVRSGCIELIVLDRNEKVECENDLHCCHADMCNHMDEINNRGQIMHQQRQTSIRLNQQRVPLPAPIISSTDQNNISVATLKGDTMLMVDVVVQQSLSSEEQEMIANSDGGPSHEALRPELDLIMEEIPNNESTMENQEHMLFLITIVVPVFGAIIVVGVIIIAIRILRNDTINTLPSSKLNRSDDSGSMMVTASIEPKYFLCPNPTVKPQNAATYVPLPANDTSSRIDNLLETDAKCKNLNRNNSDKICEKLLPSPHLFDHQLLAKRDYYTSDLVLNLEKGNTLNVATLYSPLTNSYKGCQCTNSCINCKQCCTLSKYAHEQNH